MSLAPIILFVYNRPWHTKQTVEALQKNELASDSELFIYSDGPKDTEGSQAAVVEVRNYLKSVDGFRKITITESPKNLGLAASVIRGVSEVVNEYGRVIVLEDDLITAPSFLKFMNEALAFYKDIPRIFSITGYNLPPNVMKIPKYYSHDIYFNPRAHSWGWATWKDRWEKADWKVSVYDDFINNQESIAEFNLGGNDLTQMLSLQMAGKIDSWAIRWCFAQFLQDAYAVYPVQSLVKNIGFDGSGVHCNTSGKSRYSDNLGPTKDNFDFLSTIEPNQKLLSNFSKVYSNKAKMLPRVVKRIRQLLKNAI